MGRFDVPVRTGGRNRASGPALALPPRRPRVAARRRPVRAALAGLTAAVALTITPVLAAPVHAETAARPAQTRNLAAMPDLPRLDPGLDPALGIGRIADLVRQRVVGTLSLLGSPTAGDHILTDGPITAEDMPDGGARIVFPAVTMSTGAAAGLAVVIEVGDILAEATDIAGGGVTYRAAVPGPITVYHAGAPIAVLSTDGLTFSGDIDPDIPHFGTDSMTVKDVHLRIEDQAGAPLVLSAARASLTARSGQARNGTLDADLTITAGEVGAARGERDPTIRITDLQSRTRYSGVPGPWLDVLELMAPTETLPDTRTVLTTMAGVLRDHPLGRMEASINAGGVDIIVEPGDMLSLEGVEVQATTDEPIGGVPQGDLSLTLTGMTSRGTGEPVAVDLGALRLRTEGQGLEVGRIRTLLGETLAGLAEAMPAGAAGPEAEPDPAAWAALEQRLLTDLATLVGTLNVGAADSRLDLSGLRVRRGPAQVVALDSLSLSGGYAHGADGLMDGPTRLELGGLFVDDPTLGLPWQLASLRLDSTVEDVDIGALQAVARAAIAEATEAAPPLDPATMAAIADRMTVAGGTLDVDLGGLMLGTEMNPMGGLAAAQLSAGVTPAPPGTPVADARLSLSLDGLDAGPFAALLLPAELTPTAATLALHALRLPLPAISRLGFGTSTDPDDADARLDQATAALLESHRPAAEMETLRVTAPTFAIDADGRLDITGPSPDASTGRLSLAFRGLDRVMDILKARVESDPTLRDPLLMLIALRGLGRTGAPGTHLFDIEMTAEAGVTINGTPATVLLGAAMGPMQDEAPPAPDAPVTPAPQPDAPKGGPRKTPGGG